MTAINATAVGMHSHDMSTMTTAAGATEAAHGAHMEPIAPKSGDPRFIDGSTGEFGQSETIRQKDGPAFGDQEVAKNQNGNDKSQNNYGETDANFTRTLGLIANPDTGQPMSYAQTMQAYNAAGAIETLAPQVYARLVANQNAGRGTVLGGALAIMGVTKSDGFNNASLTGIDDATVGQLQNAQLPGLGSLKEYVIDTRDLKGREWNRAHHAGSAWKGMTGAVEHGYSWPGAALLTGDSMTSWSGRVLGSNNQDGDETGFAADELAGLKYLVLTEQATGKSALESVLGGHAATHLPEDKLTDPKINKLIGLPEGYRPQTQAEIDMVAGRIRQWALQPDVQVDEGEFNKFVQAGNNTTEGRQLAASGLLDGVQFKAQNNNNNNGGGGNGGGHDHTDADVTPTGLGTRPTDVGGGDIAPVGLVGSPTIDTRPTLDQLGVGGPFPVLDPATGKLNKKLQDQLMTSFVEMLYQMNDSPFLDDDEERDAFIDGAKKGVQFLKDSVAASPEGVTSLKDEIGAALADGSISDAERASLVEKLNDAGMDELAGAVADGSVDDKELATISEKIDGAASAKLEKDVTAALEDGELSAEERKGLEGRLGDTSLKALEDGIADGTVTSEELEGIRAGVEKDETAKQSDAVKGAAGVDGDTTDATKPDGAKDDAVQGAEGVKAESAKAEGDDKTKPADGDSTDTHATDDADAAGTPAQDVLEAEGDAPPAPAPTAEAPASGAEGGDTGATAPPVAAAA